jgi:(p)ppGpp synthase/HD superfamily hydrolase
MSEEQRLRQACYRVEALVSQQWPMVAERRKDYIAEPKTNGYQSLHVSLELESAGESAGESAYESADESAAGAAEGEGVEGARTRTLCELQIRTQQMHDAAERGDAAHFAYKGGLEPRQADGLKKWTTALQAVRTCSL